jgi:hypothetical protein
MFNEENDIESITVTNVATGVSKTFGDFIELGDRVEEYGHDLVQSFGRDGSITLRFDVKYADPEPEVEADAYDTSDEDEALDDRIFRIVNQVADTILARLGYSGR